MSVIHDRIKERRLALGLTLAQLADMTGVKEATAQRWESGNIKTIKYDTVEMLANILHCTPQYLMGWEEKAPTAVDERTNEFVQLFSRLSPQEQDMLIAQMKGILASRGS